MEISVFIQNLAKYNEGSIVGDWVTLPVSDEELRAVTKKILGDDEELEIADYSLEGISLEDVHNYTLTDLNELAALLEDLDEETDLPKVRYLLQVGENLVDALDSYEDVQFYQEDSLSDLAYQFYKDGSYTAEDLAPYVDWDSFGDSLSNEGWTEVEGGVCKS